MTNNDNQIYLISSSFVLKTFGLLVYSRLIDPPTAQGHLKAFYKACTLHKHKIYKHNPKVSLFGIALIKNGNKVRRYH